MRVKIGDKIYDSREEPIMIILEEYNKRDIENMSNEDMRYCVFPQEMNEDDIERFMERK